MHKSVERIIPPLYSLREGISVADNEFDLAINKFLSYFSPRMPVILAFWWPLWYLGASWWKAPLVGLIAASLVNIGWGGRWIARTGFALVVIATTVWIGALPPPQEWIAIASSIAPKLK